MSSSKVYSAFTFLPDKVPVGSEDFIDRFQRAQEENSDLGRKLKELELNHQADLEKEFERGYEQGSAAAARQGEAALNNLRAQVSGLISELMNYRSRLYSESTTQLLELAFAIADRIVAARGAGEQAIVIETINKCLSEILDRSHLRICVSPGQLAFVKDHITEISAAKENISRLAVEQDARIEPGGCVIETESGFADGRFESQLAELKSALLKLYEANKEQ